MSTTPTMPEVLDAAISYHLRDLNTALPSRVITYYPETQSADVQPLIKRRYKDGVLTSRPVIQGVPMVFPSGGGATMTFPVKAGDTVLVIFSQRSIDRWVQSQGGEVDPEDNRKHDFSDAIAIPGLFTFNTSLGGNSDNVEIKFNDGKPNQTKITMQPDGEIVIDSTKVTVNAVEEVTVNAPLSTVNGNLALNGSLAVTGDVNVDQSVTAANEVTAGTKKLSTHKHTILTGSSAPGPTAAPTND